MVDTTPLVDSGKEEKIGHKYCGCCCDSRRAVLIFNIFNLIFALIAIFIVVGTRSYIGAYWAFLIVGIIIISLTIAGAALYNKWMVILGALWAVITLIKSFVKAARGGSFLTITDVNGEYYSYPIVDLIWAIIWQGLVLYADITFIVEVSKGIMSRETYKKREEQSCCCV
ncbi:hypothetical protein ACHAWT_002748 [Skeletonema menzelii]